ncbi:ABC transporter ATP-binding protein [Oryzibacter oryziterrae]|uniref:ABC transporter ATP-binding protein n=1 Tax=Oryzibacter oryziterrae TaxID=2766474 RepID=UPI001F2C32C2|nr:ABC transporter ATP-binding protein [Oryzibacter oryziterrae]
MSHLLVAHAIERRFDNGVLALEKASFHLEQGEVLSLLGASGCGKSTLLRLIADLDVATGGRIDWPGGKPKIGFVFQDPTLMPWATVFDNVWLPLRFAGVSRKAAEADVRAALDLVGLEDAADLYPRELSGGMRMRVSIARAVVDRPGLLLMDEPFAALDEITRQRLNADLLDLRAKLGASVLFVTHSVAEATFLSDRIAVMAPRPGRIVAVHAVPFGRRDEALRTDVAYARLSAEVSASLRATMEPLTRANAGR